MANINQFAAFEISRARDFNPDTGVSWNLVYAGSEAQLIAIANYWETQNAEDGTPLGFGYRTIFNIVAGSKTLTVKVPDQILYTTRWDIDSCTRPINMFWLPAVREYLGYGALDLTTIEGLRSWLAEVRKIRLAYNIISNPSTNAGAELAALTQAEQDIVYAMIRDSDTREYKQSTLKRCRTIPYGLFETRVRLVGRPQLYSLDGIYNLFGLDDATYDQAVTIYNDLPTADPNTVWSWKLGPDRSGRVIGGGKVEEVREWIFARWDTINNTFVE